MKKIISILFLSAILIQILLAHPHVYIDLEIQFDVDEEGITGFRENWIILHQFGESIAVEYDADSDGVFNPEETERVKKELFDNIIKYNYYTYFDIGGKTYFPEAVRDFSVEKSGDNTVLSFFVPCRLPEPCKLEATYELTVHDISRYVSFGLKYIDDPFCDKIDYRIRIERDGNFYSHSCDFGNAVIIIDICRTGSSSYEEPPLQNLVRLTQENKSPSETVRNPFLENGTRIQDDNPNPFISY